MTRAIGSRVEAVAGGRCINFHTDVSPRTLQVHLLDELLYLWIFHLTFHSPCISPLPSEHGTTSTV